MENIYTLNEDCDHSPTHCFYRRFNWNIPSISKSKSANGFIVQHFTKIMTLTSINAESCSLREKLEDEDYYEAWSVKNGECEEIDHSDPDIRDDNWDVGEYFNGDHDSITSEFVRSIGTAGRIDMCCRVFWIPKQSELLYEEINKWPLSNKYNNAGGLRSVSQYDRNLCYVFPNCFSHTWDLTDDEKTKKAVTGAIQNSNFNRSDEIKFFEAALKGTRAEHLISQLIAPL